ncbi:conserved hypothetical protein [Candidatus Desulfosporosinus infrequens]|uniref:Uncharacterized protein n=1 Tax=Candidatus Desulfosporosinus infrequens TaxID=2043169 RepID=A0A2U3KA00_9FIRM|nr:conserved hypothetical protein [Candidatus Desulfosporosinus infrequens]
MEMDQLDEIMQKSIELGRSIGDTTIYQEFKKAEYNLLHNPKARELVENLQKMKQEYQGKQMTGIELSKEEQETMKAMENKCLMDKQVQVSNDANTKFQEFMEKISGKIKEGIKSIEQI